MQRRCIFTGLALALWAAAGGALVLDEGRCWVPAKTRALQFDPTTRTWQQFFLPGNIYALDRDRRGGLWFATQGGLARYHQEQWQYFTPANTRAALLPDDNIQCLALAASGKVWAGTAQGGLLVFEQDRWTALDTAAGLAHQKVNALLVDRAGCLWAGTADGLSRFDGKKWQRYSLQHGLVGNYIKSLGLDGTGRLWAECYNYMGYTVAEVKSGVAWFDGNRWHSRQFTEPIVRCALDGSAYPVVVTRGRSDYRLYSFINEQWTADTTARRVNDAVADSAGRIWAGTDRGLYLIEKGDWSLVPATEGREVTRLWPDRTAGPPWCLLTGPNGNMLGQPDQGDWKFLPPFPKKTVTAMARAGQTCWLATSDGLWQYDGAAWKTEGTHVSVSRYIKAMAYDPRQDALWIGTERGLACRRQGVWRAFFNPGLVRPEADAVVCDYRDTVWAFAGGWHFYNGQQWTPLNESFDAGGRGIPLERVEVDAGNGKWFYSPDAPDVKRCRGTALTAYASVPAALEQNPALGAQSSKESALWLTCRSAVWAVGQEGTLVRREAGGPWRKFPYRPLAMTADSAGLVTLCERYRVVQFRDTVATLLPLPGHIRFRDVVAGAGNALWIEGEEELLCYRDDRCTIYPFPAKGKAATAAYVWQPTSDTLGLVGLVADTLHNVWLASADNVWQYTPAGLRPLNAKNPPIAKHLNRIALDANGALWAIHNFGASRLNGGSWKHYNIHDGLISNLLYDILPAPGGVLWFCSLCGVSRYDGKTWTSTTRFGDLAYPNIQYSALDSAGAVWLGTLSGALTYRDGAWRRLRTTDGLLSDSVYALGFDRQERLWCATPAGVFAWRNGVARPTYRALTAGAGSAFRLGPNGQLWLLRRDPDGGERRLYRLAGDTWEEYGPEIRKTAFAFGPDGTLYVGAAGGFFIIQNP